MRLGLQREAELGVDDERAVDVERVAADALLHPVELGRLERQRRLQRAPSGSARSRRAPGSRRGVRGRADVPVADGELGQLGRHRLALQ